MTKIITNNNQVPNGGYSLGGHSHNSNVTLTGGAGLTYTTATGAGNWSTNITVDPYYTKKPKVNITSDDIEIDGLSLKETMLAIKNELMIPTRIKRNEELEQEFDELKACSDRYAELEKKFLEQKTMWETLKK